MAVKDGLPATDFSRQNREWVKAVAGGGSGGGGGLPEITEADEGKVLTVESGEAAWATAGGGETDPYPGWDVVIAARELSSTADDYEVKKLDYDSLLAKVRAGELVTGVLYDHYNYDEDVDGGTNINLFPLIGVYMDSMENGLVFYRINSQGPNSITSVRVILYFTDEGTISRALYTGWDKVLT